MKTFTSSLDVVPSASDEYYGIFPITETPSELNLVQTRIIQGTKSLSDTYQPLMDVLGINPVIGYSNNPDDNFGDFNTELSNAVDGREVSLSTEFYYGSSSDRTRALTHIFTDLSGTNLWAVFNIGLFTAANNGHLKDSSTNSHTITVELFQKDPWNDYLERFSPGNFPFRPSNPSRRISLTSRSLGSTDFYVYFATNFGDALSLEDFSYMTISQPFTDLDSDITITQNFRFNDINTVQEVIQSMMRTVDHDFYRDTDGNLVTMDHLLKVNTVQYDTSSGWIARDFSASQLSIPVIPRTNNRKTFQVITSPGEILENKDIIQDLWFVQDLGYYAHTQSDNDTISFSGNFPSTLSGVSISSAGLLSGTVSSSQTQETVQIIASLSGASDSSVSVDWIINESPKIIGTLPSRIYDDCSYLVSEGDTSYDNEFIFKLFQKDTHHSSLSKSDFQDNLINTLSSAREQDNLGQLSIFGFNPRTEEISKFYESFTVDSGFFVEYDSSSERFFKRPRTTQRPSNPVRFSITNLTSD